MERADLVSLIMGGNSIRAIASARNTSFTNVRYWLKKHGLSTGLASFAGRKRATPRYDCPCGETDPLKFTARLRGICAKCHNGYTHRRQKANKVWAVEQKGGKCQACGYSKYVGSLDFHHMNPAIKDRSTRRGIRRTWSRQRIKSEIDKCILVCRNCHGEIHAGLLDVAHLDSAVLS